MARNFNGSTDKIAFSSLGITNTQFTIAAWCYKTSSPSSPTVFEGSGVSASHFLFLGQNLSSFPGINIALGVSGGRQETKCTTTFTNNVWTHIAGQFDTTTSPPTSGGIFINGVKDGSGIATVAQPGNSTYFDGPLIGNSAIGNSPWPGNIADLAIWFTLLTQGQITALANGARPHKIGATPVKVYFPLWGLSSPEPDLSGNANNGTLTGTALATTAPPTMQFTPRWPQTLPAAAASAAVFRRTLSSLGTRVGSRQVQASE
jgi:hypothetical protein